VAETIKCPDCSTKYYLRPERLHPGIKRLRCFRCNCEFFAGDTVARVLGLAADTVDTTGYQGAVQSAPVQEMAVPAPSNHIDDLASEALKDFATTPEEPLSAPSDSVDDLASAALKGFAITPEEPVVAPSDHIDELASAALQSFAATQEEPVAAPSDHVDDLASEALKEIDTSSVQDDTGYSAGDASSETQIATGALNEATDRDAEVATDIPLVIAQTDLLADESVESDKDSPSITIDGLGGLVEPAELDDIEAINVVPPVEIADNVIEETTDIATNVAIDISATVAQSDLLADESVETDEDTPSITIDGLGGLVEPAELDDVEAINVVPPVEIADDVIDEATDIAADVAIDIPATIAQPDLLADESVKTDEDSPSISIDELGEPASHEGFELVHDDIADVIQGETPGEKPVDESISPQSRLTNGSIADVDIETEKPDESEVTESIDDRASHAAHTEAVAMSGGTVVLSPRDILAAMASSVSMNKPAPAPAPPKPIAPVTAAPREEATVVQEKVEPPKETSPESPQATANQPSAVQEPVNSESSESSESPVTSLSPMGERSERKDNTGITESAEPDNNEAAKLKVKMDEALIEHLTIEELSAMAENGTLQEHHLVARQFSENWIQAPKVPALRPIFDKIRQENLVEPTQDFSSPPQSVPGGQASARKGLFSGLFGRN